MFFLLRMAFWLTIVLALLPIGSSQPDLQAPKVGASEAAVAASAAVSDMSGFCERQPGACEAGAQVAVAIGQRAQAGAKMVYEFIHDQMAKGATGSVSETKTISARELGLRGTLGPSDLQPAWQGQSGRTDSVPLPRKDPRHKA
jgi:hypothetical protein